MEHFNTTKEKGNRKLKKEGNQSPTYAPITGKYYHGYYEEEEDDDGGDEYYYEEDDDGGDEHYYEKYDYYGDKIVPVTEPTIAPESSAPILLLTMAPIEFVPETPELKPVSSPETAPVYVPTMFSPTGKKEKSGKKTKNEDRGKIVFYNTHGEDRGEIKFFLD